MTEANATACSPAEIRDMVASLEGYTPFPGDKIRETFPPRKLRAHLRLRSPDLHDFFMRFSLVGRYIRMKRPGAETPFAGANVPSSLNAEFHATHHSERIGCACH